MDEAIKEIVIQAGGRAVGPLRVAFELAQSDHLTGRLALEAAITADITEGELWYLYKDVHNGDLLATRESLCLGKALDELSRLHYSKHYRAEQPD